MALTLMSKSGGRRDQNEALDLIAGADDCILIRATETFNDARTIALVVNEDAVIGNLIADDVAGTDVVAGGLVQGYKNIDSQTLKSGAFIPAGRYRNSRSWTSVTVTSGSVWAYIKYDYDRTA
jgi:hypothetical protein